MPIWLASTAFILFLATFSVWRYAGLIIPVVLYIGIDLIGSDAWFAKPEQDSYPVVPGMELYLTILVFSVAFDNKWLQSNRIMKLATGGLFILGISLYSFYFPLIVEQDAYSLITLGLLLGLPYCGASILNKIRTAE